VWAIVEATLLLLESYSDYMCDEPITRLIVTIKCFGFAINLIVAMEVDGSKTFDWFDMELHLFSKNMH
jgi:hypothetical protein